MAQDKYIRFDWAAKKILRDKANFSILEGLVTVLLNESVKIIEILESESRLDCDALIDAAIENAEVIYIHENN